MINLFKNDLLPWFFSYINKIQKTANTDSIINDMKKISDFEQYFQEFSQDDQMELDKLKEKFENGELEEKRYHTLKNGITNKYYKTLLTNEQYLYQMPRNQVTESIRYIYYEAAMIANEHNNEKFTLYVIYDVNNNGNKGSEIEHGKIQETISECFKNLNSKGISLSDGIYLTGNYVYKNFLEIKQYAEDQLANINKGKHF